MGSGQLREEGKADAETDLAVTSNSLAPPSATQSLLTTASRTAKQRACLAGAILVALTAAPAPASLLSCSGIPAVKATPSVESAAISCSAAEQAAISEISVSDFSDDRDRCCHTTLALTGISHGNSTGLAGAILVLTAQSTLASWPSCTGIPAAKATSCFESAAISCSAAEQAATQKMPASDLCDDCDWCGHTALTLTGISHDKLDGCSTAALGTRLSQTAPTRNGGVSEHPFWVRGIPRRCSWRRRTLRRRSSSAAPLWRRRSTWTSIATARLEGALPVLRYDGPGLRHDRRDCPVLRGL